AHQLASFAGYGALDALFELPERVAAVTAAEVQRVAQHWLRPERRTVGWHVPRPDTRDAATDAGDDAPGVANVALPPPAPLDEVPAAAPVVRTLAGGIPAIVQSSDLSPAVHVELVLAGGVAGDGIEQDRPVPGHSSASRRVRPGERAATLAALRETLEAARAEGEEEGDAADPESRLEQAFARIMSVRVPASTAPVLAIVTGDVDPENAFGLLEQHFGDLAPPRGRARPVAHGDGRDLEIALGRPVAQAQLGYIVRAPGPAERVALAWRLLLYVVSHGYEGRLGKEAISNRGLAYYIDSRYRSDGVNGWVTLAVGVDPEKLQPLE